MAYATKFKLNNIEIAVQEDEEIIQQLLNDNIFTSNYFEKVFLEGKLEAFGIYATHFKDIEIERCFEEEEDDNEENDSDENDNDENDERNDILNHQENNTQQALKKVWFSKGKPTSLDEDATHLMLDLRLKFSSKFNDKKTTKIQIWKKIADEMRRAGYDISPTNKVDPSNKCKQKFAHLQENYLKHINNMKMTGAGFRDPPPFFSELHSIIGNKDKANPQHLQDSESLIESEAIEGELPSLSLSNEPFLPEPQASTSQDMQNENVDVRNRFHNIRTKTSKGKSGVQLILDEIQKQHKTDREERAKEFTHLKNILEKQNEQRGEFISIFKKYCKSKKRGHSSSESD